MRLGSLTSATFVVAVLASSPSFAQLHIGVDMEEGENDVLTPVHPSQTSTMYAYDCVSLGGCSSTSETRAIGASQS